MSRWHGLLIPVLTAGLLLLAGLFTPSPLPLAFINSRPSFPAPAPLELTPAETPAALAGVSAPELLDRVVARYGPEKVAWLETTFRQHARYDDVVYQLDGRYLSAPNHRIRVEMDVQTEDTTARLTLVSDGRLLSESLVMTENRVRTLTLELPRITAPTDDPAAIAFQREQLLHRKSLLGVIPLLKILKQRLGQPEVRAVDSAGTKLLEIRGAWTAAPDTASSVPADIAFRNVPRACHVYLDADTLWPRRVEWWGSPDANRQPHLLLFTEYDDPVINQPLPPERLAETFAVGEVAGTR